MALGVAERLQEFEQRGAAGVEQLVQESPARRRGGEAVATTATRPGALHPAGVDEARTRLRRLRPDLVASQQAIVRDDCEQPRDLLGPDFHLAHQRAREHDGSCVSIASRWPIGEVRQLDGRQATRPHRHPFPCGTLAAEVQAPKPLGRLLFINTFRAGSRASSLSAEFQAVAAARLVEKMVDCRPAHVVLAGDLDAEPDSASVRFLAGLQSLGGTSVRYRDAWRAPNRRAWPHVHPANPLVTTGESGVYALELGRRIDYVFVRCSDHGPTLDIRACDRLFDQPIDRVWASDHFGVTAQPLGYACRRPASALTGNRLHARASAET